MMNFKKESNDASSIPSDEQLGYQPLATTSTPSTSRRTLKKGMKLLPADYVPNKYSVFCGRGKGYYNAVGNRRLRVIVNSHLRKYLESEGIPTERSRIITQVKDIMMQICPLGAFIKFENGSYYELSDKAAREKVSAMFRDTVQAGAKGKQAKKAIKASKPEACTSVSATQPERSTSSSPAAVALALPSAPVAVARRPSLGDSSTSSNTSSIGSFYDVDTKEPVSIHDSLGDDNSVYPVREIRLEGLSELPKKRSA